MEPEWSMLLLRIKTENNETLLTNKETVNLNNYIGIVNNERKGHKSRNHFANVKLFEDKTFCQEKDKTLF